MKKFGLVLLCVALAMLAGAFLNEWANDGASELTHVENSPNPYNQRVVLYQPNESTALYRVIDPETRVICYVYTNPDGGGVSCLQPAQAVNSFANPGGSNEGGE